MASPFRPRGEGAVDARPPEHRLGHRFRNRRRCALPGDGAAAGQALTKYIKEGPLAPARTLDIARQTLRGLAFATARHRSPRSETRQRVPAGAPRPSDHVHLSLTSGWRSSWRGAGRGERGPTKESRAEVVFGTPSHMSPSRPRPNRSTQGRTLRGRRGILSSYCPGVSRSSATSGEQIIKGHLLDPVPSLEQSARPFDHVGSCSRSSNGRWPRNRPRDSRAAFDADRAGGPRAPRRAPPRPRAGPTPARNDRERAARAGVDRGVLERRTRWSC